jgi:hypothetical protein
MDGTSARTAKQSRIESSRPAGFSQSPEFDHSREGLSDALRYANAGQTIQTPSSDENGSQAMPGGPPRGCCELCHYPIPESTGRGCPAKFCSAGCRQKAFRIRAAAGRDRGHY